MSNLYESADGNGLLIYSFSNQIILRQKVGENISRGMVLASDYLTGLSHAIYNGILHYSYINLDHQLVLKRTTDSSILFLKEDFCGCLDFAPVLVSFSGKLFFIYQENICQENSEENLRKLCSVFPFRQDITLEMNLTFPSQYAVTVWNGKHCVFVEIYGQEYYYLLKIKEDFTTEDLASSNLKQREAISLQSQEIQELSNTLDSVISQYNELMDVALQYKQEAIKWRSKFSGD